MYLEGKNIRRYLYSTSPTTNPLRYSSLMDLYEVHGRIMRNLTLILLLTHLTDMGEMWANMLHNVYAALVVDHG
jgi:extracellular elastinolytic metalloproteinase